MLDWSAGLECWTGVLGWSGGMGYWKESLEWSTRGHNDCIILWNHAPVVV